MAKQQRMFMLTVGCILGAVNGIIGGADHALVFVLWIILLGSVITSVRRIMRIGKATIAKP